MQYTVEPFHSTKSRFFECHVQEGRTAGEMICHAHVHDWVEILYCYSGQMNAMLGGKNYSFCTHDLLIIHSHEVHQIIACTDEKHEYIVIKFLPELMSTSMQLQSECSCILPFLLQGSTFQKRFTSKDLDGSDVPSLISHFAMEYTKMEYGYEIALKADFYNLILWILRQWHISGSVPKNISTPEQMQRLQMVLDYIINNYHSDITIDDMAKLCHVSYSYFSRLFFKMTGQSFSNYLTTVRLSAAEKLLITTEMSITEISFETGFCNLSYFTRRFTAKNGITPREYRKKYRILSDSLSDHQNEI